MLLLNSWVIGLTLADASDVVRANPALAGSRVVSPASSRRMFGAQVSGFVLTPAAHRELSLHGRRCDVYKLAYTAVRNTQKYWAGAF